MSTMENAFVRENLSYFAGCVLLKRYIYLIFTMMYLIKTSLSANKTRYVLEFYGNGPVTLDHTLEGNKSSCYHFSIHTFMQRS